MPPLERKATPAGKENLLENARRYFTYEVYQNVAPSLHMEVPNVAQAVFDYYVATYGTLKPEHRTEAVQMAVKVLNDEMTVPEPAAQKVDDLSSQVRNKMAAAAGAKVVAPRPRAAAYPVPAQPASNPLPDVFLNTDLRGIIGTLFTPEDLREGNPFNGVGALEDMGAFDPEPPKESLRTRLKKMVEAGADEEAINREVQKALGNGTGLKEVMDAVQGVYNDPKSSRSQG